MRCLRPALLCLMASILWSATPFEVDVLKTSSGPLELTFIGHGTLMFQWGGKTIHVDPVASMADYTTLPKADLILVTHEHGDHLDPKAIEQLQTGMTRSQVRYLLGTPMVPDAFDRERWDYLYFLKTKRLGKPERRLLTVYFEGDKVARFERQGLPPPASAPTARPGSTDAVEAHGAGTAAPSS